MSADRNQVESGQGQSLDNAVVSQSGRSAFSLLSMRELLALLALNYKVLIFIVIATGIAVGVYLSFAKKVYQVEALIQIKGAGGDGGGLGGLMGGLMPGGGGGGGDNATMLALFHSGPVMKRLYNKLLQASPEDARLVNTGHLRRIIKISGISGTNLYRIIVEDNSPTRAAFLANNLIEAFLEDKSRRDKIESSETQKGLDTRIKNLQKSLMSGEKALSKIQKERGVRISSNMEDTSQERRVATMSGTIFQNGVAIKEMIKARERVRVLQKKRDYDGIQNEGYGTPVLARLLLKRDEVAKRYRASHPRYQEVQKELANSVEALIVGIGSKITRKESEREFLLKERKKIVDTLADPAVVSLRRQIFVDQQMYKGLIKKSKELEVVRMLDQEAINMLDPAPVPKLPIRPRMIATMLIGLAISIFGGLGLIFLKELFQPSVLSDRMLEQITGINVIKSIERIPMDKTNTLEGMLFLFRKPNIPQAEAFRYLRSSIEYSLSDEQKVFMITSADADDGKSFVSMNLAAALALGGRRTLIMELDLRKPSLSLRFQNTGRSGLFGYFHNKEELNECLVRTQFSGLDLLLAGRPIPNPVEIIGSERFRILMDTLRQRYEVVIIDAPRILGLADTLVIGNYTDITLLVAVSGQPVSRISQAVRQLKHVAGQIKGAVINKSLVFGAPEYGEYVFSDQIRRPQDWSRDAAPQESARKPLYDDDEIGAEDGEAVSYMDLEGYDLQDGDGDDDDEEVG